MDQGVRRRRNSLHTIAALVLALLATRVAGQDITEDPNARRPATDEAPADAGLGFTGEPAPPGPWHAPIVPAPEPFSLNSYDVIDAVWLIRRAHFLQYWDYRSRPETVTARTVESVWVGFDPDAYEGHQNRYDIVLNGEPIDWDHLYVEYAGDMINLRLLYTYRNQKPPPDVPYRLRWP